MSRPFNKAMGMAIKELRMQRGLSQEAVGNALEVTFQQVQKYENGINGLSASYIPTLAKLFGITVAELYERAGACVNAPEPGPQDHDAFLAARYVAKISDPRTRQILIDMTRKFAYRGEVA